MLLFATSDRFHGITLAVMGGGLLALPWVSRCCFKEPDLVPIHLAALFAALDVV
jgi:hypothetical protein